MEKKNKSKIVVSIEAKCKDCKWWEDDFCTDLDEFTSPTFWCKDSRRREEKVND